MTFDIGLHVEHVWTVAGRTLTSQQKFLGWIDYQIFLAMRLRSRARGAPLKTLSKCLNMLPVIHHLYSYYGLWHMSYVLRTTDTVLAKDLCKTLLLQVRRSQCTRDSATNHENAPFCYGLHATGTRAVVMVNFSLRRTQVKSR